VEIEVEIFWVVMPCSYVVGYQCFGAPCCLHLQVHPEYGGSMDQNTVCICVLCVLHAPAHLILLDFNAMIIFGKACQL